MAEFRAAIGVAGTRATVIAVVGLIAGLLLIVTEFSTIASVNVASGSCEVIKDTNPKLADRCDLNGFDRHGGAFILLGLVVAVMAWGAGIGGSRPAAVALIAIGILVAIWGLALDLHEAGRSGAIADFSDYENATGHKGAGLYLELLAAGLAILAGVMRLVTPRPSA